MVDHEGTDGRQLGEGVRPGPGGEGSSEVVKHVVAGMVAERHEERAEKHVALAAPRQPRAKALRSANEHVVPAALGQRAL